MATLTRKTQKVFAGNANGDMLAVMGTMQTGNPVYSADVEALQNNAAYTKGWSDAILNDKAPYMEEMNGVQYGFGYQIAYLLQEGIPEYDTGTNYSDTSIVKVVEDNNLVLYHSLIDNNQGVADITTSADWSRLYIVDFGKIGDPILTLNSTLPDGLPALTSSFIWLDGSAVSRSTYAALFAIYGTTYGAGNGSSTFNLPNFINRAIWGSDSFGTINAGFPNITAVTAQNGKHTHGAGTQNIRGFLADLAHQSAGASISATGCFSVDKSGGTSQYGYATNISTGYDQIEFNAANSGAWTGRSTEEGQHNHDITVSLSTAGIMGNSSTVQPPAIKVRVCTRWK